MYINVIFVDILQFLTLLSINEWQVPSTPLSEPHFQSESPRPGNHVFTGEETEEVSLRWVLRDRRLCCYWLILSSALLQWSPPAPWTSTCVPAGAASRPACGATDTTTVWTAPTRSVNLHLIPRGNRRLNMSPFKAEQLHTELEGFPAVR